MFLSNKFKNWVTHIGERTCTPCLNNHGKIYYIYEPVEPSPPVHSFCRCTIERLEALIPGTATDLGRNGADWWLRHCKRLPGYYIRAEEAINCGWISKLGNLGIVCPDKMLFNGIYENKDGHLPSKEGRVWYEIDINYKQGYRGSDRIVFSNDGLIFVTYDHYHTFKEIL